MPYADRDDAEGQEQDEVQDSETYKANVDVSEQRHYLTPFVSTATVFLLPRRGGFDGVPSTRPVEHFDSNPVRVEDEQRVVTRLVAILFGREVNVRAARETACVRLINLPSLINLEGEVLDADVVVTVSATVGWT